MSRHLIHLLQTTVFWKLIFGHIEVSNAQVFYISVAQFLLHLLVEELQDLLVLIRRKSLHIFEKLKLIPIGQVVLLNLSPVYYFILNCECDLWVFLLLFLLK